MRFDASRELTRVEEWVQRNKNFRDSIKTLTRDAKSVHQFYGEAFKKSLNGFVHPYSNLDESTYPVSGYPNSAPAIIPFGGDANPVPISWHYGEPGPVPAPPTADMTTGFTSGDTTTGSAPLDYQTVQPSGTSSIPLTVFVEKNGTTVYNEFSNSTPSEDNFDTMANVSLRLFFGLEDESGGADDSPLNVSPSITKYVKDVSSEDAVRITRRVLNKTLEEGLSGNSEIFFFATNLYAASPELYGALKKEMPSVVDTVVSKSKYKLQLKNDEGQTYALLVNSTNGMRPVQTLGADNQEIIGGYWKFLPRSQGDLFLLFNVDTATIIGTGSPWETDGLAFKDESDIIVQPFPDTDELDVKDNFLWNLYAECDNELHRNSSESSEYEKCSPVHEYLGIRNKEFHNLRLTLEEGGNPALKSVRYSWRLMVIE